MEKVKKMHTYCYYSCCCFYYTTVLLTLASRAMEHWGTCPFDF